MFVGRAENTDIRGGEMTKAQTNTLVERESFDSSSEWYVTWGALAGLSLAMLLSALGTSVVSVALPTFATAFDASFGQVQWIVLSYLLTITALIVTAGRLGDMLGRKRLLLAGLLLFVSGALVSSFSSMYWQLILGRIIQGCGGATMMALTMALVGEVVSEEKTGTVMGMLGTMSAIGTVLGPSLGGVLIAEVGWPSLFLLNIPLGFISLVLVYFFLSEGVVRVPSGSARFDWAGTGILAMSLIAYALAMTIDQGHMGQLNVVLLVGAGFGGVLFVWFERRASSPLIALDIFRTGALTECIIFNGLVSTVMMTTLVVGPFYLSRGLGLEAALVGLIMSIGPGVVAVTGVLFGRVVDKFGTSVVSMVGLFGIAGGSLLLSILPASMGIGGYVAAMVTITLGYSMFQTANNTAVMKSVSAEVRGVVSGVLNLSRNIGFITGASVMGALFAFAVGSDSIIEANSKAVAEGMHTTFAVAAAVIGGVAVYSAGRLVASRLRWNRL